MFSPSPLDYGTWESFANTFIKFIVMWDNNETHKYKAETNLPHKMCNKKDKHVHIVLT